MEDTSDAFLMKLGWAILKEQESLWSLVLRHKYFKGSTPSHHLVAKKQDSALWRGI